MSHIFISYQKKDVDFAIIVKTELEKESFETWTDQGELHAGDDWRSEIDKGIQEAGALILILTPASAASAYVTYEWACALGKGIRVIPLLREKTEVHPRLEMIQHLNFSDPAVRPWDKLIDQLKQLGLTPSPQPPVEEILEEERLFLRAIDHPEFRLRSVEGIAKQAEISEADTMKHLLACLERGFVFKARGIKGEMWALTQRGRIASGLQSRA